MLVETVIVSQRGKNGQLYKHRVHVCVCDACGATFETRRRILPGKRTYHDRKCQNEGRRLRTQSGRETARKISNAQIERLKDPRHAAEWKRKLSLANKAAREDGSVTRRMLETYENRYGETPEKRMKRFFREKHGVDHPSKLSSVKYKLARALSLRHKQGDIQQAFENMHGVSNPMQVDEFKVAQQQSIHEKYGVKTVLELDWVKQRSKTQLAHLKRHMTMKKNGSYGRSRPEDFVYAALVILFGEARVERQKIFCKAACADFFVGSPHRVFVQVDGEYWHGLGKTIEEVKRSGTKHSKNIILTMRNDEKQNRYFQNVSEDGEALLRISDRIVMRCIRSEPDRFLDFLRSLIITAREKKYHVEY